MKHNPTRLAVALVLLTAGLSSARNHASTAEPCVQVLGHLSLEGIQADHLFVRSSAVGKRYLYAVPAGGPAAMVVNVSDPSHPILEMRVGFEERDGPGDMTPIGVNAAIVEIADHPKSARAQTAALRNIGVMDLSDPANPKVVCRFEGVSGYLLDDSKSLIYIVNGEGLWIVRHHEPPDPSIKAWEQFAAAP